MRLEQLYYLVEVSKTKSITRFANNNSISHQSVSKALYQLEEEFKVQLLNRTPRGVSLTPRGMTFAKEAAEILSRVDDLARYKCLDSESEPIGLKGSLSISTSIASNMSSLQDIADEFSTKNPYVKLKIIDQLYEDIVREVKNGKVDFGLVLRLDSDSLKDAERGLVYQKIVETKVVLLTGKSHPLAGNKSISMRRVLKEPLVLYESADFFFRLLYSYGKPNIFHVSKSKEIQADLISRGEAVGLGLESLRNVPLFRDLVFVPIRDRCKVTAGLLHSVDYPLSAAAQNLISILKSFYKIKN